MKAYISAEEYALSHYYLAQCKGVPIPQETLDHYRNLSLRHMPEDRVSLLRRPGLQFEESDFSDEIVEVSHYLLKNIQNKIKSP